MSPNVVEPEGSRKRTHDEYAGDLDLEGPAPLNQEASKIPPDKMDESASPSRTPVKAAASIATSSSDSPKQALASTAAPTQQQQQPAKRKKLTAEEKAAEKAAKEKKDREREEKAKEKAAEKAAKEKKDREREEKAKEKEEKRAKEAKEKADKKAAKEEERRKKQEAEDRKQRSQTKLGAFFSLPKKKAEPPSTATGTIAISSTSDATGADDPPVPPAAAAAAAAPSKSEYEKRFQPFCIYENTRLALSRFRLDGEPLRERELALDSHIARQQQDGVAGPPPPPPPMASSRGFFCFNSSQAWARRGVSRRPVKFLMDMFLAASEAGDNEQVQRVRQEISAVPMKQIAFSQDVRPPYRGTLTLQPHLATRQGMARLARKPTSRGILPLHYDYDSEAEWVDEEDGEDVDMDDDEEEMDDEDDMDGFLDDSEDHGGPARAAFQGDMEPESSGLCFEDQHRQGPNGSVYKYRLEMMVFEGTLEHTHSIDPFSSQYWPSESPKAKARLPGAKVDPMAPPAGPLPPNSLSSTNKEPPKHIAKDKFIPKIKKTIIENKELTKASLEDILHKRVEGITKVEAKHTLVHLAEQTKEGKSKIWKLKEAD